MTNQTAVGALLIATVVQALDLTIATIALPAIEADFGIGVDTGGWILTCYIVAMALMTPTGGAVSAKVGRRNALLLAIGGLTLASSICGLSPNLPLLLAGRVVQGASAGLILPIVQATLLDLTQPSEHGRAMSLFGAASMVGPVLGPSIGGVLVDAFGWRAVFLLNLPIGLLAFVATAAALRDFPQPPAKRIDGAGLALFGIGIIGLQLLLDRGNRVGWLVSSETLAYAGVAIVGLGAALVRSRRRRDAFPSLAPFRERNFAVTVLCSFLAGFLVIASIVLVPSLLQRGFGYGATTAGLAMAPRGVGTMVTMLAIGRTVGRIDHRILLLAGIAANAVAVIGFMLVDREHAVAAVAALSLVQGLGVGMIFTPLSTAAFTYVSPTHRADATGLFSLLRHIGSGVGVSVVTGVLFLRIGDETSLLPGYRLDFVLLLVILAIMALVVTFIRTHPGAVAPSGGTRRPSPTGRMVRNDLEKAD